MRPVLLRAIMCYHSGNGGICFYTSFPFYKISCFLLLVTSPPGLLSGGEKAPLRKVKSYI